MCGCDGSAEAAAEQLLSALGMQSSEVYRVDDATVQVRLDAPTSADELRALRRRIGAADSSATLSEMPNQLDPSERQLVIHVYDRRERWRRWFGRLLAIGLLVMVLAVVLLIGTLWMAGYHDVTTEARLRLGRARAQVWAQLLLLYTRLEL